MNEQKPKNSGVKVFRNEALAIPQLIETTSKKEDWVKYGEDNLYPNYLVSLLEKSAIHKSIQTGKQDMTIGDGLTITNQNQLTPEQLNMVNDFIINPNNGETLEDLTYKIAMDLILYGAYALNIIWSKDRKSVAEVYHIDYGKLRAQKPVDGEESKYIYYSNDWSNIKKEENVPELLRLFDYNDRKEASQIYICTEYSPSNGFYARPQYSAAIPFIEIDFEIGMYHLNNIQNALSPDYILQINNGIPEDEEQDTLYRQFKRELTGHKGHKFMMTFGNSTENAPSLIPIPTTDADKQFLVLNEAVLQALCTANKVTSPMLLGIKTPGQLGGRSELLDSYDLYYATVINKLQKHIIKTYNKIMAINGASVKFDFIKPQPLPFTLSESALLQVATQNEVREMLGLKPLPSTTPTE